MTIINILKDDLINQIAAGEVIERPASVVKELIENSIDASSTDIRVDIQLGGKRLIRICDNGIGMDREDAIKCFERHATSKLKDASDLFNIVTMGFRGEALSSIAAISKLSITTALNSSSTASEGTFLEIHGGILKGVKDKVTSGTTIEVRDLFYNTPVRKKFLKSTSTELYHIMEVITQAALIHPQRRFSLYVDEKEALSLPASTDIDERIAILYGNDFLKTMLPFENKGDGLAIRGFVSKEDNVRRSRSHQYIFVNKRCIRDNVLRHAIYQAFKTLINEGAHPVFFLYIDTDPTTIDCNVHPTKQEVRFLHKDYLYSQVLSTVRSAILRTPKHKDDSQSLVYEKADRPLSGQLPTVEKINDHLTTVESMKTPLPSAVRQTQGSEQWCPVQSQRQDSAPFVEAAPAAYINTEQVVYKQTEQVTTRETTERASREEVPLPYVSKKDYLYIGDVFVAYVGKNCIVIADHHAAHERVLYERLRDGSSERITTHRLLFPIQLKLPLKEFSLLRANINEIMDMGIEIEEFGSDTFIIRGLPYELENVDISAVLSDIASHMVDETSSSTYEDVKDVIAKRIACHSAVRGSVVLSNDELNTLFRQLESMNDPHHCPHGRPTRVYLSHDDLRKLFKRK
ncbi:MAG: DNA mismatch repair endonuclease MutL [Nitrospirae bacterium]|nr:DNA mismatch repair endonuclease MutL [Nitrospirota bacterium]